MGPGSPLRSGRGDDCGFSPKCDPSRRDSALARQFPVSSLHCAGASGRAAPSGRADHDNGEKSGQSCAARRSDVAMTAQAPAETTAEPAVTTTAVAAPVLDQHRFPEDRLADFMEREGRPASRARSRCRSSGAACRTRPSCWRTATGGVMCCARSRPASCCPRPMRWTGNTGRSRRSPDTDVPVARAWALCEDESVIGRAFYIMEHVEGRVARNLTLPDLPPAERARPLTMP